MIKQQRSSKHAFHWQLAAICLTGCNLLLGTYVFLRKKQTTWLPSLLRSMHKRYQLTLFIRNCQRLKPRPVPINPDRAIDVSIIIPVFNQWALTKACLNSILATHDDSINVELILADDCSTDETTNAASHYPGLVVVKTQQNLGFLLNCNHAAQHARGRYLLLLNNDTIVLPNWLRSLYKTISADEHTAIVGSKMLYRSGLIQEAGAALLSDGTTRPLGKKKPAHAPLFNFLRETDYCSGCSIIMPKPFWNLAGGFDKRYHKAYCEDVDLALTARQLGMKVMYQPESELVHLLHKTYNKQLQNHNQLIKNNRELLVKKWQGILGNYPAPTQPWHITLARAERWQAKSPLGLAKKKLHILLYAPIPTHRLNHGNRARVHQLAQNFREMGHEVHFVMLENFKCNAKGLELMCGQYDSVDLIACKKIWFSNGKVPFDGWYQPGMGEQIYLLCKKYNIDVAICSYIYQSKLLEFIPEYILKVIDTHDKIADRARVFEQQQLLYRKFSCSENDERDYLNRADIILGITKAESDYFAALTTKEKVLTFSHVPSPQFINKQFAGLNHIGFVASSNEINQTSLNQLITSLKSYTMIGGIPFMIHVAGDIVQRIKKDSFDEPWLKLHGFVPRLDEFYRQMDLIISPAMFGTGINIKTTEAMSFGMPILTTLHASRGTGLNDSLHRHEHIEALVASLFFIKQHTAQLERLATISRQQYWLFYQENKANFEQLLTHKKLGK